jgi:hypothetical protein
MSETEHPSDQGGIAISDDRARAVDEAGRRAGAALRSPAPAHGVAAIQGRAHRRRVVRVAATSACVGVLIVGGVMVIRADDGSVDQRPVDTLPNTELTTPNSTTPDATTVAPPTTQAPATAAAVGNDNAALTGRWTTEAIPIEQIRTTLLAAGFHAEDVDQWVRDVGSPSEMTFSLEFNGDKFTHFTMTPEQPQQADETGTFVYDANRMGYQGVTVGRMTLVVDQGITFELGSTMSCCDELKLHNVDSKNYFGRAADGFAMYYSAPFHRWGDRPRMAAQP